MARKYSRGASKSVKSAMRRRKRGTLRSGRSGKKVTSRKQAVAITMPPQRGRASRSHGPSYRRLSAPRRGCPAVTRRVVESSYRERAEEAGG